jgi:hypothetical protein
LDDRRAFALQALGVIVSLLIPDYDCNFNASLCKPFKCALKELRFARARRRNNVERFNAALSQPCAIFRGGFVVNCKHARF